MDIKIVFPTCVCAIFNNEDEIVNNIKGILEELQIKGQVTAVRDLEQSLQLGVINPPAVVINNKIVACKQLPAIERLKLIIKNIYHEIKE